MQKDAANLVELEKCCQTHIFLQIFVLIQPRTSPPKICKFLQKQIAKFATEHLIPRERTSAGGLRSQAGSGEPTPTEKAMVVRELTVKEGSAAVRGRRTCARFRHAFFFFFRRDALKEQFGKDQTRSDAWP